MNIWWVTTFPDKAWPVYAQDCIQGLIRHLPLESRLCAALDSEELAAEIRKLLRASDLLETGWQSDHQAFVQRNNGRDHPAEYRLQATRFCHKIFVLNHFFNLAQKAAAVPEYLVWWDADAMLTRNITDEDLATVLPRENEACSYLGRKDWDHSECGFMGFNMKHKGAGEMIRFMHHYYDQDLIFGLPQWHDSFLFDIARSEYKCRNLSEGVPGNNVWAATALAAFSEHWKGDEAKKRKKALSDKELFAK
jgi:hypothetical protein